MSKNNETVILIHGLWMHGIVFLPHQHWLSGRGYAVRRFSYPTVSQSLRHNTEALARFVSACNSPKIHLLGHSMGGLVILNMLAQHPDPRIRRVVLMGSPSMSCHSASVMARMPLLSLMLGRSMKEWLALPRPQLPASVEIGIIAGSRSMGLGRLLPGLPRPNDGVVSIAETRLPEARDFIILDVSHTGMLVSPACSAQVAAFLDSGSFIHA